MSGLTLGTWLLILAAVIALDMGLMWIMRRVWQPEGVAQRVELFGRYSPVLTWLKYHFLPPPNWQAARAALRQVPWAAPVEVAAIVLWALVFARRLLNFDTAVWVGGGDWMMNAASYYGWMSVYKCGLCVLWNGTLNGGAPTFVELVGAVAHPLVVALILLVGIVSATKGTFIAALIMAGLGQWWLSRVLRLGLLARLWPAALAVVGGHLAGRLEGGLVEQALATGACSLVIPAALDLALHGRRRAVAVLGLMLGLAVLAGQGYMQIALVGCVLPGLLPYLFNSQLKVRPVWRSFLWAGVIAILVAAVLWVPFLHFWPNFEKPTSELDFADAPRFEELLSYLVIPTREVYGAMQQAGYLFTAASNVTYIGWLAVALALIALPLFPGRQWRLPVFFGTGILLLYLVGSATLLRWMGPIAPEFVSSLRTPSFMVGLAVPLILGLAAYGLDRLTQIKWPPLSVNFGGAASGTINLKWIVVAVPLFLALRAAYRFSQDWIYTSEEAQRLTPLIDSASLIDQQWVVVPLGETGTVLAALQADLKVTNAVRPWKWHGREFPEPYFEMTRDEVDETASNYEGTVDGFSKLFYPENVYAYVDTDSGRFACGALARGGNIDVTCQNDAPGTLIVRENSWSGWSVRRDGAGTALGPGQWLSAAAPAGSHRYEFRYRPWDVPVGLLMSLAGLALFGWAWLPRRRAARSPS